VNNTNNASAGSMKTQLRYAFMSGLRARGAVIVGSVSFMLIFGLLGSLGNLPSAAHITALALGGCAIGTLSIVCIIDDIAVIRRFFFAPDAYLFALTPAPRGRTLLANVIPMAVLDIIPLAAVITGQVWLVCNYIPNDTFAFIGNLIKTGVSPTDEIYIIGMSLLVIAAYLFVLSLILFCITAYKSVLFKRPASGLLVFLLVQGCLFAFNLLQILLAPFGTVTREYVIFIQITLSGELAPAYALLILLQAAVLFVITSKLMERKLNI
jgi:hypothetical protein